mgnify:CR=1 FL=1
MITWNNLDTLESFKELSNVKKSKPCRSHDRRNVQTCKNYSVPMALVLHITMLQSR